MNKAVTNIDNYINLASVSDDERKKAYKELSESLSNLINEIVGDEGKALKANSKLKESGYYNYLLDFCNRDEAIAEYAVAEINAFCAIIDGMLAEPENKETPEFDVFQAVRNAIYAIPTRFVLGDAVATGLEGSTTEIPYTLKTESASQSRYFGVENISKYIYSIIYAALE